MKRCLKEGCDEARITSSSGIVLSYCEEHQKDCWRKDKRQKHGYRPCGKKQKEPKTVEQITRKCIRCKQVKNLAQDFEAYGNGYKRICKVCSAGTPPPKPGRKAQSMIKQGRFVLIHTGSQLILASVLSETAVGRSASLIIESYRQQGYDIEHVYERKEDAS